MWRSCFLLYSNYRSWPLAAHLDSEIGADFGSVVGWKAEPGPWLTKISEIEPKQNSAPAKISMAQGKQEPHLRSEEYLRHLQKCLKKEVFTIDNQLSDLGIS